MSEPAPRPIVTTTSFLLMAAGRTSQRRLDERLAKRGLSLRHVGALGHLATDAALSYSDLARRAGVTVPSMHATIGQLRELGAVTTSGAGQGRRARLALTARGRRLLRWAGEVAADVDAELLDGIDPEQLAAARSLLAAVALRNWREEKK